ncbi:hypothetical protein D3C77_540710 [compost metagenome]
MVDRTHAQLQPLVEQSRAQIGIDRVARLQAAGGQGVGEPAGHAFGHTIFEHVEAVGVILVTQLLLEPVSRPDATEETSAVKT